MATRFTRAGTFGDKHVELGIMQLKRFEGDQIAEVWEYYDPKQLEG